jgi:hypothetical protein
MRKCMSWCGKKLNESKCTVKRWGVGGVYTMMHGKKNIKILWFIVFIYSKFVVCNTE